MSRKLVTIVYDRKVGSVHRKAVLAYFADRASDNGKGVWASKKTIADETECGRSTVIKIVSEFVEEGLIVVAGTMPCRNGATVIYDLNVDAIMALPMASSDGVKANNPSTSGTSPDLDPSTSGTPLVHQRDPMGSTSGTQTVHEPSMNQSANALFSEGEVFEDEKPPPTARLPSGWVMPPEYADYARTQGLHDHEIEEEGFAFHAYFTDKREKRSDRGWLASWQRWARKAASERKRKPANGRQNGPDAATQQIARLAGLIPSPGYGGR